MPPVWGWILAYLLGFLLFQAVVYWYLGGEERSLEEPTPGYGEIDVAARPTVDRPEGDTESPDGTIRCPHCGAFNERESSYRYCQECVRELL